MYKPARIAEHLVEGASSTDEHSRGQLYVPGRFCWRGGGIFDEQQGVAPNLRGIVEAEPVSIIFRRICVWLFSCHHHHVPQDSTYRATYWVVQTAVQRKINRGTFEFLPPCLTLLYSEQWTQRHKVTKLSESKLLGKLNFGEYRLLSYF